MDLATNAIDITWPREWRVPFVFSSPHSGRNYPPEFVADSCLSPNELRQSEDFLVDLLFQSAPDHGAPLLKANFPRAYCDVNREAYELDPQMFNAPLPDYVVSSSPRVACGIGTIPRVVGAGKEIYPGKLGFEVANCRIHECYYPYHRSLTSLIEEGLKKFGVVYLIDCHSMPSAKQEGVKKSKRPDIILGNRYGTSCNRSYFASALRNLESFGYVVGQNSPYAGGFITANYGRPENNIHALQIEINRSLYMDQTSLKPIAKFDRLQQHLGEFISRMVVHDSSLLSA
jgi:N-formylglutamate amidohydrolase